VIDVNDIEGEVLCSGVVKISEREGAISFQLA
jgi:hypothetical protein